MTWPIVVAAEVCQIVSGGTPRRSKAEYWNGEIPWVTPKEISRLATAYLEETEECITEAGLASSSAQMLPPESVLLSSRAPIGLVAINRHSVCTNQGFKSFIPDSRRLDSKYLYHYLSTETALLNHMGSGSTFSEISGAVTRRIPIPLPPLDVQKKIAAVLDKADELRRLRQQAIAKLDDLAQSVFLDMFGDPVTNPKGWEVVPLGLVVPSIENGHSPVCADGPRRNGWGVLKLSAVTGGKFRQTENKALLDDVTVNVSNEVHVDDLLMTRKNTYDKVGQCAFVFETESKLLLPDTIFRLIADQERVSNTYLWSLLNLSSFRPRVAALASGSAGSMPNISKERLRKLQVPIPPMARQQEYGRAANHLHSLGTDYQRSASVERLLIASLTQRAFRGDLFS